MKIYDWDHYILFCFFIAVIDLIFYRVVKTMENIHAISVLTLLSIWIPISSMLKNRYILMTFIDVTGTNVPRYFYTQFVLLTWALILCLSKTKIWTNYVIKLLLIAICIASISYFRVPPMVDFKWSEFSKLIGKRENLVIPINPPGWTIELK